MTAIENTITKSNLIFAEFKAFQDLSHRDVCQLFGCSMQESMEWARGNAPAEIDRIALIANKVAERARLRGMSDTDIQYFEKQKENLLNEITEANNRIFSLNAIFTNFVHMSFLRRMLFLVFPSKTKKNINKLRMEFEKDLAMEGLTPELRWNWFD